MATERIHTKDGGVIRVDRGDDGKVTGMTIINPGSSGYSKGDSFSRNDSGGITHTDANGNQRTGTVNWNNGEGNPRGSTITWDKPNFSGMKFGQGIDDTYQQTRNQELSDFYSKNGNYSYNSIYNDLMQNEGFKNASAADQKATVEKILASANKASGGTVGMKFGADAYADNTYDINDRNSQLASIAKDKGYSSYGDIYGWLENSSQAFKDASPTDKDNTVKKLMAMNKWNVESQSDGPTEDEIKEENKDDDDEDKITQEDYLELLQEMQQKYLDAIDARDDYRRDYYNKNPNEDTINGADQKEEEKVSLNHLSLAANKDAVNGDGAPEYVDPNLSTATPYLTPDKNVKQDFNNAGDQPVETNVGLIRTPTTPQFAVYNIDTPEGIIQAGNDALTNIMNGQYGGDTGVNAYQAVLLAQNRLRNWALQNGIQEGTPEYMNLFRQFQDHPIRNYLATKQQEEGMNETSQTE